MKARNFKDLSGPVLADPKRRANVERIRKAALREHARFELAELRKQRGRTQVQLAEALGVEQTSVSRAERSADPQLSTLREYIEALGGHLELAAVFDDGERVVLEV
ncbi:MAG: helix-turn-helix transcriptional regulator [Polyangiaceae bacterium]